jgi:predicted dienelactone hydrolase
MAGQGEFAGRFDVTRMGISGHSYGSVSTLVAAGQRVGPAGLLFAVDAFRGAFAMSPAPPRAADPTAAFANMIMPVFHLTGTEDGTPLGDDLRPIDRRIPFDTINNVDQYLLVLDKGVHSTFSGRRDRPYPEIDRHHALIRMAALAFWDAELREDASARAWLEGGGYAGEVGASGVFEVKRVAP